MSERDEYLRCPRCRNDHLTLTETHEEHGITDGRHRIVRGTGGREIIPATLFQFEPGDPVRIVAWCENGCGHEWSPRRVHIGWEVSA